jgi:hexokinase
MIDDDLKLDFFYFRETHKDATIKCYPTFVSKLPSGRETGRFLALDLGGTNFRVLQIDIGENKQCNMESKVFAIPKEIMIGTGDQVS